MALIEQDREDLFRDGRAMVVCGEADIDGDHCVVGFRKSGALSLYFGPDVVFQFDQQSRLRSVFLDGERYTADAGQLQHVARLNRGAKLTIRRETLPRDETQRILRLLGQHLARLRVAIAEPAVSWRVRGTTIEQWPSRVWTACQAIGDSPVISGTANV